ncbi:hypothetical protein GCM10017783_24890 [Deinococcus piscis]|uniref:Cyclic nucleotide-binding domain-containing protein n=1 Tax=Deinococcus piscis TaxID=394230 RepID=A0ABQ3KER9_9DEIO|nr:hypothetical protein GCM10017783_24890 [Deinococcus piscis]
MHPVKLPKPASRPDGLTATSELDFEKKAFFLKSSLCRDQFGLQKIVRGGGIAEAFQVRGKVLTGKDGQRGQYPRFNQVGTGSGQFGVLLTGTVQLKGSRNAWQGLPGQTDGLKFGCQVSRHISGGEGNGPC